MIRFLKRALAFVFGLLLLLAAAGYIWLNPGRGPQDPVDPAEKGWAEEIDGTLVVHLKGTPYEMGYQRGHFAREKVLLTMERFEGMLDMAKKEVGLPRFAAHLVLDIIYQLCSPYIPDRYKREMEGLADATGCDLKMIRRGHVISVITERGCSSFALWGGATKDGTLYHGRNFDWILTAGLEDTAILAVYEPDGLHPFVAAGYAGMIGVLSGMNKEHITIAQIGAVTDDKSLRGQPLEFVLRRMLEECGNLDEVTRLVNSTRHTVGFNYVVSDGKTGDARAYETTANHVAIFGPDDPKETVEYAIRIPNAVFRADEAMDPTVRSLQRCANAPRMPYGSNSYDHRYKGIATRVKENYGKIDAEIALEILKATGMVNTNLHAVLTDGTNLKMWVAHAKNGKDAVKQHFVEYDLKTLFLRPEDRPPVVEAAPAAEAPAADAPAAEAAPAES